MAQIVPVISPFLSFTLTCLLMSNFSTTPGIFWNQDIQRTLCLPYLTAVFTTGRAAVGAQIDFPQLVQIHKI